MSALGRFFLARPFANMRNAVYTSNMTATMETKKICIYVGSAKDRTFLVGAVGDPEYKVYRGAATAAGPKPDAQYVGKVARADRGVWTVRPCGKHSKPARVEGRGRDTAVKALLALV